MRNENAFITDVFRTKHNGAATKKKSFVRN